MSEKNTENLWFFSERGRERFLIFFPSLLLFQKFALQKAIFVKKNGSLKQLRFWK